MFVNLPGFRLLYEELFHCARLCDKLFCALISNARYPLDIVSVVTAQSLPLNIIIAWGVNKCVLYRRIQRYPAIFGVDQLDKI